MTPEPLLFDPELEGILRELAADPRSRLLRLPRRTGLSALLARPGPVSAARTGLTAAERHLVEVHRDELADVLRRACLMRFYSDPDRAMYLNRHRDVTGQIAHDTPEQWRARARDALADARRSPEPLAGLDLLEACLRHGPGTPVTITQLARASNLLQPTDVAEAYVGLDLVLSGMPLRGSIVMQSLLEHVSNSTRRSCILENLGHAESGKGDFMAACAWYRAAAMETPERPSAFVGWLFFSLQAAEEREAVQAARGLDQVGTEAEPTVRNLVSNYSVQKQAGILSIGPNTDSLARKLHESLGPLAKEVARVLIR